METYRIGSDKIQAEGCVNGCEFEREREEIEELVSTHLVPAQYGRRGRLGLAGEVQRVAGLHVAHRSRRQAEVGWRCIYV